jgi:hypothetical protein
MEAMFKNLLPAHPTKNYSPVNRCVYCGSNENLSDEHIVPYGLGGRWVLPKASCAKCAAISGAFEGTCLRTMFGPLRMYYDLPSRRRKSRPKTLPLKVKYDLSEADWTEVEVDQEIYPFLITFPNYLMPDELSGYTTTKRDSSTASFWIRGASFRYGLTPHLEELAQKLKVAQLMPVATFQTHEFCLMLAKIAHAFAVAELGLDSFSPFLTSMILNTDTSNSVQYVGGLANAEPRSNNLHEISFDSHTCDRPDIVAVRIRLLASLETPTYYVAVGRKNSSVAQNQIEAAAR